MDALIFLAYFGGAAFVIAALLVALGGRTPWRLFLVAVLGFVLAGLILLLAFLQAPTDTPPEGCSDCTYWLGRYWEPGFVLWIITVNLFAWSIGIAVGGLAHPWTRRQIRRRPSA